MEQQTVKKDIYRSTATFTSHISGIKFRCWDGPSIAQLSHMEVETNYLYVMNPAGKTSTPHPLGPLSGKLGTSQKDGECESCYLKVSECPGHYGYIQLHVPVYHVGFFDHVKSILQCICKTCARLLLDEITINKFHKRALACKHQMLKKPLLLREVTDLCKKTKICHYCGERNGHIKKDGPLRIIHDIFRANKADESAKEIYRSQFKSLQGHNPQISSSLPIKGDMILYPSDIYQLFDKMVARDISALCIDAQVAHPRDLFITRIPVGPNCIRPSVVDAMNGTSREDDITLTLQHIVNKNNFLIQLCDKPNIGSFHETYEELQVYASLLVNATTPLPNHLQLQFKPRISLVNRLKGKCGRFRANLSGKRVDFSGRTVISPDPNLKIDQVGIPLEVAKILSYPEKVTDYNIKLVRQLVRNRNKVYPGAVVYIPKDKPKEKKSLVRCSQAVADNIAQNIRIGDTVERHMMDGDVVLFNRQPSLHKMSIMSHLVRVLMGKTFRFNECVCNPYNADFDGDEMNIHLPQTEEARAEAKTLMSVTSNLVTPQSGNLIIGATQDFITGSYLLTKKDAFFDKDGASKLVMSILEPGVEFELPLPAIVKPLQLWTGKQLFSLVLCLDKDPRASKVCCNLEVSKCNDRACKHDFELCINDNHVNIRNSELLSGVMDKSMLGAGSKVNVFYTLLKDYGKKYTAEAMWRVARISIQFLLMFGFTIGIGDLSPSPNLLKQKQKLLDEGYANCRRFIEELKSGQIESSPGCTPDETLEQLILSTLSKTREEAGKICMRELTKSNSTLVMSTCGSKGSVINISQMIACVGQQAISGKRVPDGFSNRSLPHYRHYSKLPETKGFVSNSFFSGLGPHEFIFHTMGGREGLVDTAVKTAETGYMQRRLMKCIEDLYVAYDGTVRNGNQDVIQFKYGDDGLDPTHIETTSFKGDVQPPLNFSRILKHIKATTPRSSDAEYMDSDFFKKFYRKYLKEVRDTGVFQEFSDTFEASIVKFMDDEAVQMKKTESILPDVMKFVRKSINKENPEASLTEKDLLILKNVENQFKQKNHQTNFQTIEFLLTIIGRYYGLVSSSHKVVGPALVIEPGTAVGALCAQSIGEPATQMTLKTFHFAGVAAMNITLGVPRIKEILNATKNISTPIITAQLLNNKKALIARQVKARIEKTLLSDICESIQMVLNDGDMFYIVKLSAKIIKLLQLKVSAETIKYSILNSKMKVQTNDITVHNSRILTVRPSESSKEDDWYQMQTIGKQLKNVTVMGLPTVNRVVIHQKEISKHDEESSKPAYELLVEGNNLQEVIATYGILGTKCTSNNIIEVRNVLGIEAARAMIIKEISTTMKGHGLKVDWRHLNLVADHMTCKGSIQGFTRHGLARVKESVLTLASFENTDVHLFNAAFHGQENKICCVSDCIVSGQPIKVGTGIFKLMQGHKRKDAISDTYKLSSEQLAKLEEQEKSRSILRAVDESKLRPGLTTPRPLLFDVPGAHKRLDFTAD